MVSPVGRDINTFIAACETLLSPSIKREDLTEHESRAVQYYLSALSAKFPALSE